MVNIRTVFKRFSESVHLIWSRFAGSGYRSLRNNKFPATDRPISWTSQYRNLSYSSSIGDTERPDFFRDWRDKTKHDREARINALTGHRNILLSNFQKYDSMIYQDRTLQKFLSDFRYWENIRQHFETGHNEIFKPLMKVLKRHETLDELNNKKDEDLITYEHELKKLFVGYNINTRALGGACDECLQYHDKKARKKYEKILHPDS